MELFKLMGTIAVDANQAHKAIDDTTAKAEDAGKQSSNAFATIGSAALKVGTAVVTAGAALGGAWLAAIEGTREYRAQMGLLDSAFQASGHSSTEAKNTYSELNAVLGDTEQAVEAAQHMALLSDNEKELSTWTDIATGVYATFGNSLPIESLAESSQEVSRNGVLTGGLIDALVWAGISEEEFQKKLDACTNEQERQDLIMNTLNGTYSKASTQYKETNKDVMEARKAQEKLSDAMAELGRIGEPILTAIKDKVADMALAAIPHLENFVKKVKDLKKWIKDNENTIDKWVAVIIGATVSIGTFLLILKWGAIMAAATKAIKAVRSAILLFNAALLANPIALVVALIAGLVAAFVYLWNNNKGFRTFWIDLWKKIRSACGSAVDWIKGKFDGLKDAAGKVKTWFKDMGKSISDKMESAQKAVKKVVDKIKGFFPLKIGKIFSGLKIPKISVSGGKAPFGIAGKGSLPSFDVKWNAQGGILTQPTIFGRMGDTLLGGGEAGAEAIAPITLLQDYIRAAVSAENEGVRATLIEQTGLLMTFLSRNMPKVVLLDTGAVVGELTPAIDAGLANRWNNTKRGNTR
jgi:phage-related minor tail protein